MCGIFGIFSNNQEIIDDPLNLARTQMLQHRGPDEFGEYRNSRIYLGHNRLSILDVQHGQQPMISVDGNVVIVYNGEIYNYPQLRQHLLAKQIPVQTTCDTEVLILLYQHFGMDALLNQIEGMFAFAIWDKEKQSLLIAKDRIGEKPVYYAQHNETFVFSSEIKTVLATHVVPDDINNGGLYEYFCRSTIAGSRTCFQHVRELTPGNYLSIQNPAEPPQPKVYWDLIDASLHGMNDTDWDFDTAFQQTESVLKQSVLSRMISDVPIGFLISGGLDSSIMTALAMKDSTASYIGLCAGNEDKSIDESGYAKLLVDHLNHTNPESIKLNTIFHGVDNILNDLPYLTYVHDEPLQFPNSIQMYSLCKYAKENGVKVLLSGEGSDEVFLGYARMMRMLEKYEGLATTPDIINELYYAGGLGNAGLVAEICGVNNTDAESATGESYEWLITHRNLDAASLAIFYDQRYRLQTLIQRQDRMGMAASIELRQPFLHYEFMTFINKLPRQWKYNSQEQQGKYLLKKISESYVPHQIIYRKKAGFPSDLESWINSRDSQEQVLDLMNASDSICSNYLNLSKLTSILADHYSGKQLYSSIVKKIFFLEIWNQKRKEFLNPNPIH